MPLRLQRLLSSPSQLQDHVNCSAGSNVIRLESLVIGELFSRVNEFDLVNLDSFLFLQRLFHSQYLVLGLKVQGLLAACQSLDKDLQRSALRHGETCAAVRDSRVVVPPSTGNQGSLYTDDRIVPAFCFC